MSGCRRGARGTRFSAAGCGALDNRGAGNQPLLGLSGPPVGSGDPSGRAPFYLTSRKYGVYADTLASGRATVAVNDRTSLSFDTSALTYNIIYGRTPADILRRYNDLAGGSLMPPLWAFDPIWWRDDHHADLAANGAANAQALVEKDADNLQRLQLYASAIWLDRPYGSGGGGLGGWGNFDFDPGPTGFPDPDRMAADLARRNMYLIGWIANRANNDMLADPVFLPGIFNAANGYAGNFTTTPGLDLRRQPVFYPAAGISSRFDYYTGTGVVTIAGSKAGPAIAWRTGDLGVDGVLEVHGVERYTSVRRNNRPLAGADVRYDAATQTMTIPFSGATSIEIR